LNSVLLSAPFDQVKAEAVPNPEKMSEKITPRKTLPKRLRNADCLDF
jgi:hypothetical protein